MFVLYFIAILIFTVFTYSNYRHLCLIRNVNDKHRDNNIPILANGRTIKAFTIEKTCMVMATQSISMDLASYVIIRIGRFFTKGKSKLEALYTEYAKSLCYSKLKHNSAGANYILNVHESIDRINSRKITIFLYGNAIYRYQDTLPIFTMHPLKVGDNKVHFKSIVFKMMGAGLAGLVITILSIKLLTFMINDYLVDNFTIEDEKILWSYLQNVAYGDNTNRLDLLKSKNELQKILDNLPPQYLGNKYNFKIHVHDDESVNITLYPGGHIVLTKGFIERLKYQNQAAFTLAHMVEHFNNRDHIRLIRNKIINLKLITYIFGENSFIGKLLVWRSDFDHNYSTHEEILADKVAIEALEEKYHGISGSDIIDNDYYKVTDAYIKLFNTHPLSNERTDAKNTYIEQKGYTSIKQTELEYKIENVTLNNKIEPGELSINNIFMTLFTQYRSDMNTVYVKYQNFLKPFNDILNLHKQLTLAELNERRAYLNEAVGEIINFKINFQNIVKNYDDQFVNFIAGQESKEQRDILQSIWIKEKNNVSALINFYTDRDRQILENQAVMIQYLTSRFGSYNITKNGIEFQTNKEKSDFRILQKRIEDILKKAPPLEINNR